MARFTQVVGNFFGGGLSVGIENNVRESEVEDYWLDNGIYVVKGWDIVRHIGGEDYHEGYDLDEFLKEIDIRQPLKEQLGDFLDAVETPANEIKVGHIGGEDYHEGYDLDEFLKEIDIRQPLKEQLGDFLDAVETPANEIKVGDIVFIMNVSGRYEKHEVIGIGEDRVVNGRNVLGVPYVQRYGNGPDNINNYIFEKARVVKHGSF